MLRALPAAAMELPRRIGPGEAPGADLRQSFDFTNIEAGRSLLRLRYLLGLIRDPYASHVCDPQMVSRVCFPRRRFDVGPRYFPGVVMVQRLRPLRLRVAPWLHRPGRVFRLPAAGLYFTNKKHGSVSSSRWSPARNRLRTVLLLGAGGRTRTDDKRLGRTLFYR